MTYALGLLCLCLGTDGAWSQGEQIEILTRAKLRDKAVSLDAGDTICVPPPPPSLGSEMTLRIVEELGKRGFTVDCPVDVEYFLFFNFGSEPTRKNVRAEQARKVVHGCIAVLVEGEAVRRRRAPPRDVVKVSAWYGAAMLTELSLDAGIDDEQALLALRLLCDLAVRDLGQSAKKTKRLYPLSGPGPSD